MKKITKIPPKQKQNQPDSLGKTFNKKTHFTQGVADGEMFRPETEEVFEVFSYLCV